MNAETEKAEQPQHSQETAGSSAQTPAQLLREEAEAFCADLERFFRRAYGEVPKASDLGELRAQQASLRDLVHRATQAGSAAEGGASDGQLNAVTQERDKFKDALARSKADFLNYQARTAKDLDRAEELALRKYVSELLPILDGLDLALQDAATGVNDFQRVKEALDMTGLSLKQVLAVRGLERIEAKGKPFDPKIHEAVAKRPALEGETPNTVAEELRSGYLWKGLVLRPVQVLVVDGKK